ncbi:MAG: PAS domain-containing sensor histidine kinase [Cyclobacteriaceae bacterium]
MKSQETLKQDLSSRVVSSEIINFLKQPAVIVSESLDLIRANQYFYNLFNVAKNIGNLKGLCSGSSLYNDENGIVETVIFNHFARPIEATLFNTLQENEFLLLINSPVFEDKHIEQERLISSNFGNELTLLEQISDFAYIHVDSNTKAITYSTQLLNLLDLKEKTALKNIDQFFDYLHPQDQAKAKQNFAQCNIGIDIDEFEVRMITAEKRLRFLNIKFKILKGEPICLAILHDNSSQKMLEMALRDNEALFRSIFEQAAVGIAQVSPKGELLMFNQKLCDILGYKREHLMSMNYLKLTFPEDVNKDVEVMNEIFANNINECIYEKRFLHKSGKEIWAKVHITVIRNEQQFPRYAVGIIDDISERKNAEQQIIKQNEDLIRLNSEMDNFVYRTSHDLRAPLASVLGLVELLKSEANEIQKSNFIEMIEKSIRRLDNSIHEILDLSRNNRMDFEYKNISLSRLVNNIFADLSHSKGFEKIRIIINIEDQNLYSDDKRLKMIFNNLLSNAVIYHNPYIDDPYIKVIAKIDKNQAVINIEDNGIGIEDKHLQNIFKMFYRANDATSGSGLGLYIVKEALEKLKGSIDVKSKLGEGTCFSLVIPNKKTQIIT